MADGPDDEKTPVDPIAREMSVWSPAPLGPIPSRRPEPGPSRDTAPPPRRSPGLGYPEQNAPDNLPLEGKTPAHGVLNPYETIPYIKRKVEEGVTEAMERAKSMDVEETKDAKKNSTIKTVAGGSITVVIAAVLNFASDCRHTQTQEQQKSAIQQQLDDHIKTEDQHHTETTRRLDQLLDLELKRGGR